MVELKAMMKDLLFSEEHGQAQPLLDLANMNRSQMADMARQPARGSFGDVAHILAGSLVLDSFSAQAAFSCQAGVRVFQVKLSGCGDTVRRQIQEGTFCIAILKV